MSSSKDISRFPMKNDGKSGQNEEQKENKIAGEVNIVDLRRNVSNLLKLRPPTRSASFDSMKEGHGSSSISVMDVTSGMGSLEKASDLVVNQDVESQKEKDTAEGGHPRSISDVPSPLNLGPKILDLISKLPDPRKMPQMEGKGAEGEELLFPDLVQSGGENAVTSWRSLFTEPRNRVFNLKYVKPKVDGDRIVVEPPQEVFDEGVKKWEKVLVGQFLDKTPPYFVVDRVAKKLWGRRGQVQVSTLPNGLFTFTIEDEGTRDWILETGTWHISGKPLIVSKWKPDVDVKKIQLKTIPIWVKLFNVPSVYWTENGISWIASAVGKPLYVDSATENGQQLSFLKVCVEISVNDELPKTFAIKHDEDYQVVEVEYLWKPAKCDNCQVFGHASNSCKLKMVKKWAPVTKESTSANGMTGLEGPKQIEENVLVEKIKAAELLISDVSKEVREHHNFVEEFIETRIGLCTPNPVIQIGNSFSMLEGTVEQWNDSDDADEEQNCAGKSPIISLINVASKKKIKGKKKKTENPESSTPVMGGGVSVSSPND